MRLGSAGFSLDNQIGRHVINLSLILSCFASFVAVQGPSKTVYDVSFHGNF